MRRSTRAISTILAMLGLLATACAGEARVSSQKGPAGAVLPAGSAAPAAASAQPDQPMETAGKFALEPIHGTWGSTVTASAAGLKPGTSYDVAWTTVTGSWKLDPSQSANYIGRTYAPAQTPLRTVTTDLAGAFRTTFTVPANDFGFQHDVLVVDGTKVIRNKAGFDVDLEVTISPNSGPVGTSITIEARGIGWRNMENSWLVGYDNAFTGWLSSVTTKGLARAVIPATGAPGTHMIDVVHGSFTVPYLNMQQSPSPNRPRFYLPFTLTEGAPVLPSDAATQRLPVQAAKPVTNGAGVWFDPPEGVVASTTTVRGAGLPPNAELEVVWSTASGQDQVAGARPESSKAIGKVSTDAKGAFALPYVVPDDSGGVHPLTVRSKDTVLAKSEFLIQPSAQPLKTTRGPSGTEILIQLNGVFQTDTGKIYHLVYDNAFAGYSCAFNSGGNVQIFLRPSGAPGWHFIDLYPGVYEGAEKQPLNYRTPQLTYAADHPGERQVAFRYAFLIE